MTPGLLAGVAERLVVPRCGLFSIHLLLQAQASLCRGHRTVVHSWIPTGGISGAPARPFPVPSPALINLCPVSDSQGGQLPSIQPGACGHMHCLSADVGYRPWGPRRA